MPGYLVGPITGFVDRMKGKGLSSSAFLTQIGKSAAQGAGGGNVSTQLSTAGIGNGADTTEDLLFTASLPANIFDVVGRCVTIQAFGNITATSATKTAKMYFGTTVTASVSYATTTTGAWQITLTVFKSGASTQIAMYQADSSGAATGRAVGVITNGSETDTAAIVCKVTGQSTAATANTVVCNGFIIDGYN